MWEQVKVTLLNKGVHVKLSDGTSLTVPWNALEQPDAVRQLFMNTTL